MIRTRTPRTAARTKKAAAAKAPAPTKLAAIIAALCSEDGATIARLVELTGWKTKTIRGVLAGTLKTRHGLAITSSKPDGVRIYRASPPAE